MVTKTCVDCLKELPIDAFYKHKEMADGHLNKCKTCKKKYSADRELALRKDPKWVEKEKERARDKYYRLGYKDKYKPTPEDKYNTIKKHREKYPEKYMAKNAAQRIPREAGTENHHWSYNKEHWEDVINMSKSNHAKLHRYMVYDQERMMYRAAGGGVDGFLQGSLLDTRERHELFFKKIL